MGEAAIEQASVESYRPAQPADYSDYDTATFAGGCFWCIEASFEQIVGVVEAVSGFAGGQSANPTYQEVSSGATQHTETVQIYFDPAVIDYSTLLQIFFVAHDPTQVNRQGPDVGPQYRSAIFYHDLGQKKLAEDALANLDLSGYVNRSVATEVQPYTKFYPAEDYHQDFERKNPDQPYVVSVSKPKIERVAEAFKGRLKE